MKNPTHSAMRKSWICKIITVSAIVFYSITGFCFPSGTVVGWGDNSRGESTIPSQLTNVVAIAAGDASCLALSANGTVTGWGYNPYGQVNVPNGLSNVVAIAEGDGHSLALTASGTVVGWGNNSSGQITIPGQLTNIVAISAGGMQSMALTASGSVVCWGDNSAGQGNVPSGLTNVVAISAGDYFNLALTKSGNVVAWGNNTYGQTNVPAGLSNVVSIAAGWNDGINVSFGLAVTSAGTVVGWGGNSYGQINVPSGLSNAVAVAAGYYHGLALTANGSVFAWGYNGFGQCSIPSGLSNVVAIAGGNINSLALIGSGPPNLQITNQPTNSFTLYGQNTAFSVSVSSSMPVSYQWYSSAPSASVLAGAYAQLTGNFVFSSVVTNGGYGYGAAPSVNFIGGGGSGAAGYASVSNGVVTSITMTNAGYGYTSPPNVVIGSPNGFIFGATNSTLVISNANAGNAGNYYVVISSSQASTVSSVVSLTLLYPPAITNEPLDEFVNAYGNAFFSVTATGTSPLSYQWLFNSTKLPGATSSALLITNVTPPNLGTYAVVITNYYGSVTSSVANLYLYPYLEMPFSGAVTYWGQTNTLSVGAWGSGVLSYQWYFNGAAIPSATSSNLVLSGIQFTNAGLYSVVVSSPYGSVTNTPEQVVVNPASIALKLFANVMLTGTVGYTYTIQSSTNLSNPNAWITETNLTLTQPIEYWDDTSVDVHTSPQKFYQVLPMQ